MSPKKLRQPAPGKGQHRGREWVIRAALLVLSPLAFVVAAELLLRLTGYGAPASFLLRRAGHDEFITNDRFACQFTAGQSGPSPFLFTVPAQKRAGTIRICVLGESAAMGTPDPAFGLPRMLRAQLVAAFPETNFEVYNAAMRGINSFAIRKITREMAGHHIDFFVAYLGNNEVIGLHGPTPQTSDWAQRLPVLRLVDWIRATRAGQWFAHWLEQEPTIQDMEYFRKHRMRSDDPRRQRVATNFRANLRDICDAATAKGASLVLCTMAVNLRDCPPLGSLHPAGWTGQAAWDALLSHAARLEADGDFASAAAEYEKAAKLDPGYAELHFRYARCLEKAGKQDEARARYRLACDLDALQFRADSSINEVIRDTAKQRQATGVVLLEMDEVFASRPLSTNGIPGRELFYEHVHPTFEGNHLLAATVSQAIERKLEAAGMSSTGRRLTTQECADLLSYTSYDHLNVLAAMARLTAGPPFADQWEHAERQQHTENESKKALLSFNMDEAERSIACYRKTLDRVPNDWPVRRSLATLLLELKRYPDALREFRLIVDAYPDHSRFRVELGNALLAWGKPGEARLEFERALRLAPGDRNLQRAFEQLTKQ